MDKDLTNDKAKILCLVILSPKTPCLERTELFALWAAVLVAESGVKFSRNVADIQKL